MNDENLIPFTERKAREIGKKGGVASGRAKREKKAVLAAWDAIRDIPLKNGDVIDTSAVQSLAELRGANITVEQAAVLAMAQQAMRGNVRAFEVLCSMEAGRRRAKENAAKKAALEAEKLRIEVTAYRRAAQSYDVGVTIIDNIPERSTYKPE